MSDFIDFCVQSLVLEVLINCNIKKQVTLAQLPSDVEFVKKAIIKEFKLSKNSTFEFTANKTKIKENEILKLLSLNNERILVLVKDDMHLSNSPKQNESNVAENGSNTSALSFTRHSFLSNDGNSLDGNFKTFNSPVYSNNSSYNSFNSNNTSYISNSLPFESSSIIASDMADMLEIPEMKKQSSFLDNENKSHTQSKDITSFMESKEDPFSQDNRFKGVGAIAGPDLDSSKIGLRMDSEAPDYRAIVPGLNIEFRHKQKYLVIGQMGYSDTVTNNKSEIKKFHMSKHYKQAFCPHFKSYCVRSDSITNYIFWNCIVKFEGETTEGTVINETEIYGNTPITYSGNTEYTWIELTVLPINQKNGRLLGIRQN